MSSKTEQQQLEDLLAAENDSDDDAKTTAAGATAGAAEEDLDSIIEATAPSLGGRPSVAVAVAKNDNGRAIPIPAVVTVPTTGAVSVPVTAFPSAAVGAAATTVAPRSSQPVIAPVPAATAQPVTVAARTTMQPPVAASTSSGPAKPAVPTTAGTVHHYHPHQHRDASQLLMESDDEGELAAAGASTVMNTAEVDALLHGSDDDEDDTHTHTHAHAPGAHSHHHTASLGAGAIPSASQPVPASSKGAFVPSTINPNSVGVPVPIVASAMMMDRNAAEHVASASASNTFASRQPYIPASSPNSDTKSVLAAANAVAVAATRSIPAGAAGGNAAAAEPVDKDPVRAAEQLEERLSALGNRVINSPLNANRTAALAAAAAQAAAEAASGLSSKKPPAPVQNHLMRFQQKDNLNKELLKLRGSVGYPSSTCLHSKYTAVGTSRGYVLVFDHFQQLVCTLSSTVTSSPAVVTAPATGAAPANTAAAAAGDQKGHNPVRSLDLSVDGDFIAAGHDKGQIIIYEVTAKKMLKDIPDASTKSIVSVRFSKLRTQIQLVATDGDGTVNLFSVTKMFFTWSVDKQCLLQGKKGEGMLATAVLFPNDKVPHASDKYSIVAIANEKVTILVALEPTVRIVYRVPRVPEEVARVGALPFLSWRQLQTRDKDYKATARELEIIGAPVLAISRGRAMQFVSVLPPQPLPDGKEDLKNPLLFKTVGEMVLDQSTEIAAVEWLSGQVCAVLTDRQDVRIIDPFDMTELECIDVKPINLVCHEIFTNPITGKAEPSYHSSVRASADGLLLVGLNQVVEARVLTWSERVSSLTDKSLWIEALALALDFYEGTAKVAIGLPRDPKALKAALNDRMVELLVNYVDEKLKVADAGAGGRGFASAEAHMLRVAGYVAIDYCITIKRTDILFADIYTKFKRAEGGMVVFLELLEPYILNDRLSTLSPETMKEFVSHYHSRGRLQQVEQCILHMDIMVLDFHQIVTLCQQHCLFTAMFYVYNRGGVFGVPIEEILAFLLDPKTAASLDTASMDRYGYKLVLYLQYCVTGRAWPTGRLDDELRPSVIAQLLSHLFTQRPVAKKTRPEFKTEYPFVRYLLNLNTREFFRWLSIVFEAQDWTHYLDAPTTADDAKVDPSAPPRRKRDSTVTNVPSHQTMLNILVSLMVDKENEDPFKPVSRFKASTSTGFTHEQELELYKFAAKYLGTGLVKGSGELLNRIYGNMLTASPADPSATPTDIKNDAAERQQALLRLLEQSKDLSYDVEGLTALAIKAQFYDVQVFLYKKQKDHAHVVESYIKSATHNPARVEEVFAYIKSVLTDPATASAEAGAGAGGAAPAAASSSAAAASIRKSIEWVTLQKLPALVKLNGTRTARLIISCFPMGQNDKVVDALSEFPSLQYEYLKSIMESRAEAKNKKPASFAGDDTLVEGKSAKRAAAAAGGEPTMSELLAASGWELTPKIEEHYIRLLCRFSPKDVYHYLTTHQNYKIDPILKLCQEYKINDASAYLLERTGDSQGALDLILATLEQRMEDLKRAIAESWPNVKLDPSHTGRIVCKETTGVEECVGMAILLCQRSVESEKLWFGVLDKFIQLQRKLKNEQRAAAGATATGATASTAGGKKPAAPQVPAPVYNPQVAKLTEDVVYTFVRGVLDTMMSFVPLPAILRKITNEHGDDELSEFRATLQGMLDTYGYEQSILRCANRLLQTDMFRSIHMHHVRQARAFTPRQSTCGTCGRSLADDTLSSQLTLFDCGHTFHEPCLARTHHLCPICSSKAAASAGPGGRLSSADLNEPAGRARGGGASPLKGRRDRINSVLDDGDDFDTSVSSSGAGGSIEDMASSASHSASTPKPRTAADAKSPPAGSKDLKDSKSGKDAKDSKAGGKDSKVKMYDDAKTRAFISRLQVATQNQQKGEASFGRFTQTLDSFDGKSDGGAASWLPALNLAPDDEPRKKIGARAPGQLPKAAVSAKSIDDRELASKFN